MTNARRKRLALPLLLVLLGVYLLAGCIPLPGNYQISNNRTRPEKLIGKPGSDKNVRLGESDWDQATVYLGNPQYVSADRSAMVIAYNVNTSTWFAPLCFWLGEYSMDKNYAARFLLLRFDDQGKLKSYRVYKDINRVRADAGVPLTATERPRTRSPLAGTTRPSTQSTQPAR